MKTTIHFKANSLLNRSCPRRYVGRGPDTMIVVAGDVLRTCLDQAPEVPLQCLRPAAAWCR